MGTNDSLENLLSSLEADGEAQGSGQFRLDPQRASELLSEQGRLGENAPLFLFKALYDHTEGSTLHWKEHFLSCAVTWPADFGPLPDSTYKTLAEAAFEASEIRLSFEDNAVYLKNADRLGATFSERFGDTFGKQEKRLRSYPVEGLFADKKRAEPWFEFQTANGKVYFDRRNTGATRWLICGIEYPEKGILPLDVTIIDDTLACDLSLTRVPESKAKETWTSRAKDAFEGFLKDELLRLGELRLDSPDAPQFKLEALEYLRYIFEHCENEELQELARKNVHFRDVFGEYWSLDELLEMKRAKKKLFVIPEAPEVDPQMRGEHPVLLWQRQTKRFGAPLFPHRKSGAGYLYSLNRGHQNSRELERPRQFLARVEWEEGKLALRELASPLSFSEVEMVGARRGSEVVTLPNPAPNRLRLVWHSRRELLTWPHDEPEVITNFKKATLQLVEAGYERLKAEESWLRELIRWAGDPETLDQCPQLCEVGVFERVGGSFMSWSEIKVEFPTLSGVPMVADRSASLPAELPLPIVMWPDPLLEKFGIDCRDVAQLVRRAHWKEEGRARWLKRYEPTEPGNFGDFEKLDFETTEEGHLWAREGDSTSRLVIWREGRPLGAATRLTEAPPGYLFVYLDDEYPTDDYWSGPDLAARKETVTWVSAQLDILKG